MGDMDQSALLYPLRDKTDTQISYSQHSHGTTVIIFSTDKIIGALAHILSGTIQGIFTRFLITWLVTVSSISQFFIISNLGEPLTTYEKVKNHGERADGRIEEIILIRAFHFTSLNMTPLQNDQSTVLENTFVVRIRVFLLSLVGMFCTQDTI